MEVSAQLSVSNGTPSYNVTIPVPPGIAGMAPNISLLYSGSAVNGPVGLGWTLQGISMITRCAGNKRVDGYARRVDYTSNDKLCLDGQRLIQTTDSGVVVNSGVVNPGLTNPFQENDSMGGGGLVREYRTEKDIYARIRGYGASGGNAANGPAYFKVWTKSGQIFEYGVNTNAASNATITASGRQLAVAWPVSRISDTVGNYLDFQYEQRDIPWGSGLAANMPSSGHEWNLVEIRYTGTAAQSPMNRLVFGYEDRVETPNAAQDRTEAYHQGSKVVSLRRLTSIRTYVSWPTDKPVTTAIPVKTFKLTYENGPITQRSRLKTITECAGVDSTKCFPATTFNYAQGGAIKFSANSNFKSGLLSTLPMTSVGGEFGALTGTFFGSGRADILRWGNDAALNALYRNVGNGSFAGVAVANAGGPFNLVGQRMFSTDGCYTATAIDFNGDGLTDILRVMKPVTLSGTSCGTVRNLLFKSNGDGSFTTIDLTAAGIDFSQSTADVTVNRPCAPNVTCDFEDPTYTRKEGRNYHLMDVNGDGLIDIVTTMLPGYNRKFEWDIPTDDALCAAVVCTRVYVGTQAGGFMEAATNLRNHAVYAQPITDVSKQFWARPYVADINGDGLSDLLVDSGRWVSRGDGNFDMDPSAARFEACQYPLDFNGDGRSDCLEARAGARDQALVVGDGTLFPKAALTTNLTSEGFALIDTNKMGITIADFDGDGRSDILRWNDDPTQNAILVSNGDSTFRFATLSLNTTSDQLQKSDGTATFVTGDFTGNGVTEILRLRANPSAASDATRNALYVKEDPTPPDQLVSVTSPTGLTTTLTWVSLPNANNSGFGPRYTSDRGTANAASYPLADVTIPIFVVSTSTADTGTSSRLSSEYSYSGLKLAYDGRGWLGFRETRQQHVAPSGEYLTVMTKFLQRESFAGMAATTETRAGALDAPGAKLLSRTTNIYCDTTAPVGSEASATADAPCASTSRLARPFLYQSKEEGWDLNGAALPVVTTVNDFNNDGDPTKIVVTTVGTAAGGIAQTFTKTTNNLYQPNAISGDAWILGRLAQTTVQNTVPNDLSRITTSANSPPPTGGSQGRPPVLSLACTGGAPSVAPTPASLSCTLSNLGDTAAASVTYSSIPGASVTGPAGPCTAKATCGTVTVTSGVAAGDYIGTLLATPDTGTAGSVAVSLRVNTQPGLSLACTGGSSTTPTPAVLSCTVTNYGQTTANSISYSTISGATVAGPTGACASGAVCGTVTVTSGTAPGVYSGTLTATPNSGSAASIAVSLQVRTAPVIALSCGTGTPTTAPTPANLSCTVTNNGQSTANVLSYTAPAGVTVSGAAGPCAAGTSCGTVVVTSGTAVGRYEGWLTVTPDIGTGANAPVNLIVFAPPAMTLACPTYVSSTTPNPAVMNCTLSNDGGTAVNSISYNGFPGVTVTGPTGACGGYLICGTVTITSGTAQGTYAGNVYATSAPAGTYNVANVTLTVQAPATTTIAQPASFSFGSLNSGGNIQKEVSIRNTGSAAATGLNPAITEGNFDIIRSTCGSTLGAGETCSITVHYEANCNSDDYTDSGRLTTSGSNFPAASTALSVSVRRGICE